MATRYRVALQGFNESERGALALAVQFGGNREQAYDEVADAGTSDLLIADADAPGVPEAVRDGGRLRDTVFVGARPVAGALSQVPRPIDADSIVRELGELVALRRAEAQGLTVDIGLPLDETMPHFEALAPAVPLRPAGPSSIERAGVLLPPAAAAEPPAASPASEPAAVEPPAPPIAEAPIAQGAPRAPAPEQAKAAARAAVRRAQRRGRAVLADSTDVLVLDDSEIALRYLCKLLGDFGFRAHPARDSQAAWALCERQRFAAAFVDMRLDADDAVDGIAICQQLKGRPPDDVRGAARVLLVSGSGQPADEVRARLAGCDAFLAKPLTRGSVARALDDCGVALPADARRG